MEDKLVNKKVTAGRDELNSFAPEFAHLNDNILTDIKTLYIDDLCVDETKRGMHIGKTIYEAVLDFAKEQGCYNVTLNVWSCNESAMKFYQSCGLKPQKVGMEVILDTAKQQEMASHASN